MDHAEAREWLEAEWADALERAPGDSDPEVDVIVNSDVSSIRYAVITQLLGKIADPTRSVMALQLRGSGQGAWDARSFATAVVLPWERDNQQVIGKSPDPYVSKPLRRPRLDDDTNVRSKAEWARLVRFLEPLETAPLAEVERAFRRVLDAFCRRMAGQSFSYPIPKRISQAHLEQIVSVFLDRSSGGLRPLAVSAALFKTLGEGFGLFAEVRSQGINEADSASGAPGDVACYDSDGSLCLAVEVKDTGLTLKHVQESSLKAKQYGDGLANLLFAVPGIHQADSPDIDTLADRNWAAGLNTYVVTIRALIAATMVLLDESWRIRLIREIGRELDERQNQPARRDWYDLLIQEER